MLKCIAWVSLSRPLGEPTERSSLRQFKTNNYLNKCRKTGRVVRLLGFSTKLIMELKPKQFRRHLRRESTTAEKILWFHFRNRKFDNLRIRRHHTIEDFTVDFYIDELKIIIKVDGGVHEHQGQSNYDHVRDQNSHLERSSHN